MCCSFCPLFSFSNLVVSSLRFRSSVQCELVLEGVESCFLFLHEEIQVYQQTVLSVESDFNIFVKD